MEVLKKCSDCFRNKPLSEFNKFCHSKDGYKSICKKCISLREAERYLKNPELIKEKNKIWAKDNPEKANAIKRKYVKKKLAEPGKNVNNSEENTIVNEKQEPPGSISQSSPRTET